VTDVRLAWGGPLDALAQGLGPALASAPPRPALLVSYFYWAPFARERHRYHFRDYSLDSGAFSAHHLGKTVDLAAYTAHCQHLLATDPQCVEVFSLDVIGDWRQSMANLETMWAAGVPAVPVYHVGEPEHVLRGLARDYPKVSLGGAVGLRKAAKIEWARQCFARIWPARIHGLGFGGEDALMALPFHSVDATNWEMGPCAFGSWKAYGGNLSIRGGQQNLRTEVEWYLRLEQRAKTKWRREMRQLDEEGPTVRLVTTTNRRLGNVWSDG
jgi:hypothetical protein